MSDRPYWYRLIGQTAVPVDTSDEAGLLEAARAFSEDDRRVALTTVGPYRISTVFLGLDHNHMMDGPPILFETMTFLDTTGPLAGYEVGNEADRRAATWLEAEEQHQKAVAWCLANMAHPGDVVTHKHGAEVSTGKDAVVREVITADISAVVEKLEEWIKRNGY
jgi:hypothetical protein